MTRRDFLGGAAAAGLAARAGAAESHPPLGAFVRAEGLRIHHVDRGAGPAVVLIHGASGNLRDFTFSMVERLVGMGLRVIAFDRPGLGFSDRAPARGWDPAVQARVLRAAAAALDVENPVVLGHSWGGAVAMAWALQAPQDTRGVLSLAGATHPWGEGVGMLYTLAASPIFSGVTRQAARLMIDADAPEKVVARIFRPNRVPEGYAAYIGVDLALRADAFRHNAEDLTHLDAALALQAPRYAGLPVPVEAIHGEADRTVWASVHAEPLAKQVAKGRLTLLPGVGHMPHHVEEAAVVAGVARLAGLS